MTDAQQREAARQFYYRWKDKGREDEDARSYWIEILTNILGVDRVTERVDFEKKVIGADGNTKRIDVYVPETRVIIEQKSLGIALDKPQAGHDGMTPYEQAKYYDNYLPFDERARWIVTSNFAEIWIYDRNAARPDPVKISLSDLQSKYHMLDFLVNKETKVISHEMELSLQAGDLVGKIYDAFHSQYRNPDDPETLKSLNKLCVRIVFCLYGEDAGIFGRKSMFHDYITQFDAAHARKGLRDLFKVLNQKPEDRDEYLADDDPLLAAFPYVNGGLFADDDIEIPPFTDEIMNLILRKASDDFDWSGISPTIFGAVFESTLNPETRRSGGMHYTSIENIHKVIDPLFLDELKAELAEIEKIDVVRAREQKLRAFQDKLASIVCLDPAAGSGNFLTEGYLQIRKLENRVISDLLGGQIVMGLATNPIKVQISQFYGIEINDFAVTVARTALWIAENQMMKETEDIVHMSLDFLPLKTNANIVEGNALRINWEDVVSKDKLMFIMGNPPFRGSKERDSAQNQDMEIVFAGESKWGKCDYCVSWYKKAADLIYGTNIRCALVSTNSICQGEQVQATWERLFDKGIRINFAYRTFQWDSEASIKAHVHCIIIGFSYVDVEPKVLYDGDTVIKVSNINGYLMDAPNVFIPARGKAIDHRHKPIVQGCKPVDSGGLVLYADEKKDFIEKYPELSDLIRPYVGSDEFINSKERYCLWLRDTEPSRYRHNDFIKNRLQIVSEKRAASPTKTFRDYADRPYLFVEDRQPDENYLLIPGVSSQRRKYIPIGYMPKEVVVSDKAYVIPSATLFDFGLLTSNVHNAWMRVVCGRLKSDYSYTPIAYNTMAYPEASEAQVKAIEETAQTILDVRKKYPNSTLADLYDPMYMPDALRKAHQANDAAVMKAYGMPIKETDEAACVAWLMRLYQEKVAETEAEKR